MSFDVGYRAGLHELASLFTPKEEEDDDIRQVVRETSDKFGPGSIGPKASKNATKKEKKKPSSDIWDDEEAGVLADAADPRPTPMTSRYRIKYRQKVTTEDIYLQLGGRSPSLAHTDEMVIEVDLPQTIFKDILVNCSPDNLDLRTPKYKLNLHFRDPIDDKAASAEWHQASNRMTIVAPIQPMVMPSLD